jgi:predicted small secreted protein
MTRARSFQLVLLSLIAAFALSGCNTVAGIGKDVKKAGEVVSETAEDCKGGCDED